MPTVLPHDLIVDNASPLVAMCLIPSSAFSIVPTIRLYTKTSPALIAARMSSQPVIASNETNSTGETDLDGSTNQDGSTTHMNDTGNLPDFSPVSPQTSTHDHARNDDAVMPLAIVVASSLTDHAAIAHPAELPPASPSETERIDSLDVSSESVSSDDHADLSSRMADAFPPQPPAGVSESSTLSESSSQDDISPPDDVDTRLSTALPSQNHVSFTDDMHLITQEANGFPAIAPTKSIPAHAELLPATSITDRASVRDDASPPKIPIVASAIPHVVPIEDHSPRVSAVGDLDFDVSAEDQTITNQNSAESYDARSLPYQVAVTIHNMGKKRKSTWLFPQTATIKTVHDRCISVWRQRYTFRANGESCAETRSVMDFDPFNNHYCDITAYVV